jgi:hypothetical protein
VIFKEWSYECGACGVKVKLLHWDYEQADPCHCGGTFQPYSTVARPNRGVIDDQLEGGPRVFETMGHEGVYIESKSQWKREMEKRGLVNVVKHDAAHYAKQRKMHDEKLRDERQGAGR